MIYRHFGFKVISQFFFIILSVNLYSNPDFLLFSTKDDITQKLIEVINKSKKRIHAAVYFLTDREISDALVRAKKRNVDVQIILSAAGFVCGNGKANLLIDNGIDVFVWGVDKAYAPIMHNKTAIFDDELFWTGSFNWTQAANKKNKENALGSYNKAFCKKAEQEFIVIKSQCTKVTPSNRLSLKQRIFKFLKKIKRKILRENKKKKMGAYQRKPQKKKS